MVNIMTFEETDHKSVLRPTVVRQLHAEMQSQHQRTRRKMAGARGVHCALFIINDESI